MSAVAPGFVYVSLAPGAITNGGSATIGDARTGSHIAVPLLDGGFDPVPVVASAGDTLMVTVHRTRGTDSTSFQFMVAPATPPIVVRTIPPPQKRDVPLNSIVVIVFSTPIDSTTVTSTSITLQHGAIPVAGTVRFADTAHVRLEFHPTDLLAARTDYQLIITQAVKDINGVAIGAPVTIPFTTGTVVPATGLVFTSVSVGMLYSCGVATTGAAYCWGYNAGGQLGTGSLEDGTTPAYVNTTPVLVSGGLSFASVSASTNRTCGVTTAGRAYCWGAGGGLGLGLGTLGDTPVPVAGGLTFASVSAGTSHSCGVTTTGAAYCWGGGSDGELGAGPSIQSANAPVAVAGGHIFASVSTGGDHTCGVSTTGIAYCWGMNTLGELGNGTSTGPEQCENEYACSTVPVVVAGGLTFATVSAGPLHTCGVATSGAPYCWGNNEYGLLGSGAPQETGPEQCADVAGLVVDHYPDTIPCSRVPRRVAGGLNLVSLSSDSDWFACGLTSAGLAYCWGWGDPAGTETASAPVAVAGGLTFSMLSAGGDNTCGMETDGVAYCWGAGFQGQLGDGTTSSSNVPVKVSGQP